VDAGPAVEAAGFVVISNVRAYGGPFLVTPDACPSDGLLEVCALRRGSHLARLRALFGFFVRLPKALSGVRYLRGRSVRVTAEEPVRYQVDGDPAGFLPATFEVLDRRLRVIVP
jgi:diacylglycerol kinase family enzyme